MTEGKPGITGFRQSIYGVREQSGYWLKCTENYKTLGTLPYL